MFRERYTEWGPKEIRLLFKMNYSEGGALTIISFLYK